MTTKRTPPPGGCDPPLVIRVTRMLRDLGLDAVYDSLENGVSILLNQHGGKTYTATFTRDKEQGSWTAWVRENGVSLNRALVVAKEKLDVPDNAGEVTAEIYHVVKAYNRETNLLKFGRSST